MLPIESASHFLILKSFFYREKRWLRRRERRKAERKKQEKIRNLLAQKEKEAQTKRYNLLLENMNKPRTEQPTVAVSER